MKNVKKVEEMNVFEKRLKEIEEYSRKTHDSEVIFGKCQCDDCVMKKGASEK